MKEKKTETKLLPEVLSLVGNCSFYADIYCCPLLGSLTNSTIYAAIVLFSFYNINSN